jgi:hypothetical protein
MSVPSIMQDKRTIYTVAAHWGWYARLYRDGVTAIIPYEERGEMAAVTWLAVYVGAEIRHRIPAHLCRIEYAWDN